MSIENAQGDAHALSRSPGGILSFWLRLEDSYSGYGPPYSGKSA